MKTKIKERPILFSAPMVRAILDGRKGQTRRVVNRLRKFGSISGSLTEFGKSDTKGYDWHFRYKRMRWHDIEEARLLDLCTHGKIGERLWVRERTEEDCLGSTSLARYSADGKISNHTWWYSRKSCPSIHMPRWASRILLEITNVRVERLNDVSHSDAVSEGIYGEYHRWRDPEYPLADIAYRPSENSKYRYSDARQAYEDLWESINGQGSWDLNPWVWVVEFKRIG